MVLLLGSVLAGIDAAAFAIVLAIATAVVGAIVAFVKIPTDRSTASMAQAQGANEALSEALEAVERERDYWRQRYESTHQAKSALYAELQRLRSGQQP